VTDALVPGVGGARRPGTGEVVNDGTVDLVNGQLLANGNLSVSGSGSLTLSDSALNRIGVSGPAATFVNHSGHRIEGAGTIAGWSSLTNNGTIAATGTNPLDLALASTTFTPIQNAGTLEARGTGGLTLSRPVTNSGMLQVLPGSRLTSSSGLTNQGAGVTRIEGSGSQASFASGISNAGRLEVEDGARLTASSLSQSASAALTRIAGGADLVLAGTSNVSGGVLELDAGTLSSSRDLAVFGTSTVLRGNGRLELPGRTLDVLSSALVAPGITGAGLIELDGALDFNARLAAELAGAGLGDYDRLTVTGAATLSGGTIAVSLLDGFSPTRGDQFDLITGATVTSSVPLRELVSLPSLGGDLFLVPQIAQQGSSQALRLGVAEGLLATWIGGFGNYTDPLGWSFDRAPVSASFPSNDDSNLFRVRIDGTVGDDSHVSLGTDVAIDRLEIGAGDALTVADGRALTLASAPNRPGSGVVHNDGSLVLDGSALGAELHIHGPFALSGAGRLLLSDSAQNRILPSDGPIGFTNPSDHTIEGAGSLSGWSSLVNAGTIAATGANPLSLAAVPASATVENTGTIEARGAGGLLVSNRLVSSGLVRVLPGSRLVSTATSSSTNQGTLRVEGPGSQATFAASLTNQGLLEVLDGARLTASSLSNGTGGLTRIAGGGELSLTSSGVGSGVLELDAGTLSSSGNLGISGSTGLLRGNGRISLPGRTLSISSGAVVSPGLDGAGLLDVDGNLSLFGRLAADLGGVNPGDYDRIVASGSASFGTFLSFGNVSVSLLDGFAPARGDRFDLISAASFGGSAGLADVFTLPTLDGNLALVPQIASDGASQVLRLMALESLTATWTGGVGGYTDPPRWSFDGVPASAFFPSNDDANLFRVRIDGDTGGDSAVSLGTDVAIDRLEIGSGDSLSLEDANLDIAFGANRPGSGEVSNHGRLVLAGSSELGFESDLVLSGSGVLSLQDGGSARIAQSAQGSFLFNEFDHRIEGAGTIAVDVIENRGTIAATGHDPLVITHQGPIIGFLNEGTLLAVGAGGLSMPGLTNTGTLRVLGGSRVDIGSLLNRGNVDVLDGGLVNAGGLSQDLPAARTRIADGGELVVSGPSASVTRGTLELDGGVLSSAVDLSVSGSTSVLRGDGRISLPGRTLRIVSQALVSPGLEGAGLLEVEGGLAFTGRLLAELGGTDLAAYDRITSTGSASITGGSLAVALLDGFAPALGDRFDLISAAALTSTVSLAPLFDLPTLAGSLFLVPEIAQEDAGQVLRLGVLEGIEATWTGGTGAYTDPTQWSFSAAPVSAPFPSNDGSNLFRARIDAAPGADSHVSLASGVTLDRLEIGAGDSLTLETGSSVGLAFGTNRPGSGEIANDGDLHVDGDARILAHGQLTLSGSGTTFLGDAALDRISGIGGAYAFANQADHRIEGAGTVTGWSSFVNRGTIAATGATALTFARSPAGGSSLINIGSLQAHGAGGISLSSPFSNSGTVHVLPGSRIASTSTMTNASSGVFRVEGAGSLASTTSTFTNQGRLEVVDGGRLSAQSLSQSQSSGHLRIASGGEVALTAAGFTSLSGVIELDDGTLTKPSEIQLSGVVSALQGTGRVELSGNPLTVVNGALVSPGLGGVGRLELDGRLVFSGGRLAAEIGGADPEDYDRFEATGTASIVGGSIETSLLDGFAPVVGDSFDLITAQSVTNTASFDDLLAPHELGGDLFFLPEIVSGASGASLSLRVVESIDATWQGGSGSYADPLQWSFDSPPLSAALPSNDASNLFRVTLDAAPAAISGARVADVVSLDQDVAIDRLEIGAGQTFEVADGHTLTLAGGSSRIGSGVIRNDGTLALNGGLVGAGLAFTGDLTLAGTGTLALSDAAVNRVDGNLRFDLRNESGHLIAGAGTILADRIENRGTIAATGTNPLVLDASELVNQGRLEIRSGSSADLGFAFVTNEGEIDVFPGGRLESGDVLLNAVDAAFRIAGSDSRASFLVLFNEGLIELSDGARVAGGELSQSEAGALTRISGGAELALTLPRGPFVSPSTIAAGVLELDHGALIEQLRLDVFDTGRIAGNGRIETPQLRVSSGGRLLPGGPFGAGQLDVVGDLDLLLDGVLEIDLGGVLDGQFDLITVAGAVELGGLVSVNLIDAAGPGGGDAFLPALGDWFDVIVADSIVDLGASFALPDLGADLFFVASIVDLAEQQALRLALIPEPGTGALLALGLGVLAARRRRIH
jgi:hypothetical protein